MKTQAEQFELGIATPAPRYRQERFPLGSMLRPIRRAPVVVTNEKSPSCIVCSRTIQPHEASECANGRPAHSACLL